MNDHRNIPGPEDELTRVERTRFEGGRAQSGPDSVVREEPLEIRLGGVPLAVVMRTPGADEQLAWGFLVTERVVDHPAQVESIRHCTTAEAPEAEDNVIQAILSPDHEVDLARLRRNMYASSSCGICGKATIENVLDTAPPIEDDVRVSASVIYQLPDRLREAQAVFASTGGLHAAGLFTRQGRVVVTHEDVGRHNAVDKVVGSAFMKGTADLSGHVLMVSGRISYEITQKALAARISIIAAVSAPSSLAIDLGTSANMTLCGFVRDQTMSVYCGVHRIE